MIYKLIHKLLSAVLLLHWLVLGIFTANSMTYGAIITALYIVAYAITPVGIGYYLSYAFRRDEHEKT